MKPLPQSGSLWGLPYMNIMFKNDSRGSVKVLVFDEVRDFHIADFITFKETVDAVFNKIDSLTGIMRKIVLLTDFFTDLQIFFHTHLMNGEGEFSMTLRTDSDEGDTTIADITFRTAYSLFRETTKITDDVREEVFLDDFVGDVSFIDTA